MRAGGQSRQSSIMSISRNIAILGHDGSGKRTLGNYIVGGDIFQHETALGTGVHYREIKTRDTFYRILTVDTGSLQTACNNPVPYIQHKFQQIHSIIFAISHGRYTDESHGSLMHAVKCLHQQAKSISALVITHCERMTDQEREAIITKFRDDARGSQVVAFMQNGTYAVGFPDLSAMPPDGILQNAIDRDEEAIRKLVKRCEKPLNTKSLSRSKNVVILGKVGSGKRTLGNRIVGKDIFHHETALGTGNVDAHYGEALARIGCTFCRILTVDTESLQPGYKNPIPDIEQKFQEIHSIIFTIPHGCNPDENHESLMHAIKSFHRRAKSVSALVITHCERMTDEKREAIIAEFRDDARSSQVAAFMQHGIHTVGFPDLPTLAPDGKPILQDVIERDEEVVGMPDLPTLAPDGKPFLQDVIERDEEAIRKLVEQCEVPLSTKSLSPSRNVVILGKVGSGKRTLGNRIVGRDIFQRETALGTGNAGAHYGEARIGHTFCRILTVDTESLQTGYYNPIPDIQKMFQEIHSIIFAIPHGRYTDESHRSLMHAVESLHQKLKSVSALVITHCEGMTDEQREAIIAEFRDDTRSSQVVAFMHGSIHTVGFPDMSTLPPTVKSILQDTIDKDEEAIKKLVEQCEVPVSAESLGLDTHKEFIRESAIDNIEKRAKEKQSNNCIVL